MSSLNQRQRIMLFGFSNEYAKTLTNHQASKLIGSLYNVADYFYGGDFARLRTDVREVIAVRKAERGCSNV